MASSSASLPPEINIITLNCWGLKFNISKLRQPRLDEIGRQLAQTHPQPSIVCLQEVWAHDDYLAIRRHLRALLPHGKFYYAGAFGAGLAILSRWPIEEATFTPYTLNGRPTAFWRGDWYVGKGIAHARLRFGPDPTTDVADVFNTHTHAPYASDQGDSYRVHREAQAWQLAKLLRAAADQGHLVLAAGDFNMTPLSAEHAILTSHSPVRDVWRVLHPDSSLGAAHDPVERARRRPVPTAEATIFANGATSNSVLNTWRWPRSAQRKLGPGQPLREPALDTLDPHAKRLDYIFASVAAREISREIGGWVVREARVGMTQRHPELGCSLSDHFSVEATLVFHTTAPEGDGGRGGGGGGTATPSISSNWPLPPGRLSSLSAFRRSTTKLLQPDQATTTTAAAATATGTGEGEEAGVDPEDFRSPAAGAFLSLQSPTPSTSRHSLSANQTHQHHPQDYNALLSEIQAYMSRETLQTRWRTYHFFFWVCVTVACYVAVWFIPAHSDTLSSVQNHAVNFALLLLSSLGLVAGVLDGLMALLFFRGSEKRALDEFRWEVKNAKALALGEIGDGIGDITVAKY
ncbi:DNase I-like protein [Cryphonectria parasitica EP155]|uniref:DNase I-like protein n=1 Tax=Cryphonectria parasitica (strain ATCC 38755 / EP155) TaxID=660469 RepID=A0A9P4Y8V0_CRYP1|nr:DNase I-like protein [Cryphonectria parasitica EP155]KAF3768928.1 DNase I-like protein [Cryphonectria parasitica EP155]